MLLLQSRFFWLDVRLEQQVVKGAGAAQDGLLHCGKGSAMLLCLVGAGLGCVFTRGYVLLVLCITTHTGCT